MKFLIKEACQSVVDGAQRPFVFFAFQQLELLQLLGVSFAAYYSLFQSSKALHLRKDKRYKRSYIKKRYSKNIPTIRIPSKTHLAKMQAIVLFKFIYNFSP